MRVGQKNSLVRQWAPKGSRPRQVKDLRTSSAYLFGAICPERGEGAALVMPRANTEAMDLHLEEISRAVAPNAHAVVLLDQAAWHTTAKLGIPENISLVPLPPKSRSSIPPKMSGNTSARTGSPIVSSTPMKPSSRPLAKPRTT